jgi:hypothetical protein
VLELEDKGYASKIEVMLTDPSVLAKYMENLVNLRWAHTAANGKLIRKRVFDDDLYVDPM